MARRVESGDRGPKSHGLAGADFAGEHPRRGLRDEEPDPGDGLQVAGVTMQRPGGDVLSEGHLRKAVMGTKQLDRHDRPSRVSMGRSVTRSQLAGRVTTMPSRSCSLGPAPSGRSV